MTLADKRRVANGIVILAILLGGWGIYTKNITLMIISFITAVIVATFEEIIIRWF